MKKKSLSHKLAKYTALIAATSAVTDAEAAVIYTDEVPDFSGGIGSQYFLDLNNDATNDFRIYHDGGSNLFIEPLAANNGVLGSGSSTYAYPFALNAGAPISAGAGSFFNNGFSSGYQSLNYGSCSFGYWCSVTDGYIGLRFDIGGNTHYGWLRMDVDANGNVWVIKDYAYEDISGEPIAAGDMVGSIYADGATGVMGADIADNANGDDLETIFTAAADETTVSEYRVIAVKAVSAGTFDLTVAQTLAATSYLTVTPNSSPTYTQIMGTTLDSDGDAIVLGQPYQIFVHSVADGTNANTDTLVQSSASVTLNTDVDPGSNIVGSDIAENSDATDLQVDFDAANSEVGIAEYRVIAVKDASAGAFDLTAAQALPSTAYEVVTTGSANYTNVFGATTTDSDGDAIVIGQPYSIFVLSVADGASANIDILGQSATTITLNTTADIGLSIVGSDISDNGNATDLQVDFDAATNETGISEYHVIAVPPSSAGTFDLSAAQALATTAYEIVTPGSTNYTVNFGAATTDSDGSAIVESTAYTIFVHSVANGTLANIDNITQSGTNVTLEDVTASISQIDLEQITLSTFEKHFIISLPESVNDWSLALISSNGQIISEKAIVGNEFKVDKLSTSGLYFITLKNRNGVVKLFKVVM